MPFSRNGGWTSLGLARDDDMNSYFKRMVQLINHHMKNAGHKYALDKLHVKAGYPKPPSMEFLQHLLVT